MTSIVTPTDLDKEVWNYAKILREHGAYSPEEIQKRNELTKQDPKIIPFLHTMRLLFSYGYFLKRKLKEEFSEDFQRKFQEFYNKIKQPVNE
ncbi:MAG: hypothetical protein M1169_04505 [Firmicutes bacterium]|nr:hypothetical protein [Bacillota bacterium]